VSGSSAADGISHLGEQSDRYIALVFVFCPDVGIA
jgi:hypothetical protein